MAIKIKPHMQTICFITDLFHLSHVYLCKTYALPSLFYFFFKVRAKYTLAWEIYLSCDLFFFFSLGWTYWYWYTTKKAIDKIQTMKMTFKKMPKYNNTTLKMCIFIIILVFLFLYLWVLKLSPFLINVII